MNKKIYNNLKNIRILHIGNIANNAYLNSKFLREKGIQSDVLCYDYYHIMGCPEWEDCKIEGKYGNDFDPDWSKENLKNYTRPNWFYQGSLEQIAKDKFNWKPVFFSEGQTSPYMTRIFWYLITITDLAKNKLYKLYLARFYRPKKIQLRIMSFFGKIIAIFAAALIRYFVWAQIQFLPKKNSPGKMQDSRYYQSLIRDFKKFFPNRKDKLSLRDIKPFVYRTEVFKTIFKNYDFVQGYSTDSIYALLANKRPYIAFEHGTLREIPFENSSFGRLTALAYRKADLVFITNADNIKAAKKLGLKNYVPIPHPFDNYWHEKYKNLKKDKTKILLFCPVRHDWTIKGIDKYIRTIPEIIKLDDKITYVFLEWGMEVEQSRKLIHALKIEKNIIWLKPLPRSEFIYWITKADIVLDQLILPSFGGITAEALQAGKPILASYQHSANKWMFPVKPPIITTLTEEDIINNITKLIKNPKYIREVGIQGKKWFDKYHSKKVVKKILIKSYKKVLNIS